MNKTLVFNIDPSPSKTLMIRIEEVEGESKDLKWVNRGRKLYRDYLLQLANGTDVSALKVLFEEKKGYLRSLGRRESEDTIDFAQIPVDSKRAIPVLKELAATGKLYFKRKPLIANFFSQMELHFHAERKDDLYLLKGFIKAPSKEYELVECDMIFQGPPSWVISRGFLQILKFETSWKWLQKIYSDQPLKLTPGEFEEFLEEIDPSLISGNVKKPSPAIPLPVLKLTDSRGAFANLQMNYGGQIINVEDSGGKVRNFEVEQQWKKDLLEAGFQEKRVGSSSFYCPSEKVSETLLLLLEVGWEVYDHKGNQVVSQSGVDLNVESNSESVLIKGKVVFGQSQALVSDFVRATERKENFISLNPGVVGLIAKGMFDQKLAPCMQGEICAEGIKIRKHELSLIKEFFESDLTQKLSRDLEDFRKNLQSLDELPTVSLGKHFCGKLREYQERGVAWLNFLKQHHLHGVLADDMGLGKTVQVLAFLSTFTIDNPVLIVMPKSLLFHWKNEIAQFMPSLTVHIHHGSERLQFEIQNKKNTIILTSYSTLRKDIDFFQHFSFSSVILDEAQAIKNSETMIAKAMRQLNAEFRLSITGTPVENHIGEILSQFDFLIPELFRDEGKRLDTTTIKRKVRPFILRRKKEDVDEQLPEKIEQTIWLEMEPEQRQLYDGYLNGIKQGLLKKVHADGGRMHRIEMLEAILRLRQICCHPVLMNADPQVQVSSAKFDTLFLDLETVMAEGKKALVFSQFTSMLKLMSKRIKEEGWKYAYLDGETKDREKIVHQFQNDADTQLFLISLKAGGVGMNLTAADYVFIYDPWWNDAVENQAIDRAHRIGRQHTVIAKRYLIQDSIEDRMMQLKQSKRALSADLFEVNSEGLSGDDLEFLLQT